MLSYYDSAPVAEHPTLPQRCIRIIQVVASIWMVTGAALLFFNQGIPRSDALHETLGVMAIGSLLVAAGIYSVLIPIRYVIKNYGPH